MADLPIVARLVGQLRSRGVTGDVEAMARSILTKSGVLDGQGELTAKGRQRQAMGAEGRAKDRAARAAGRRPGDYRYDPRTNRATLRR